MALTINTNVAATMSAANLNQSNAMLQKSLSRLSSGVKIVNPADDAGGLAVSMKMQASLKRTGAVQANIGNALSYLQTQDGALKTAASILDRMSELRTLYDDATKSTSDKSNYQTEFSALQSQLTNVKDETFNAVSLFGGASDTMSVKITEDAARSVDIDKAALATNLTVSSTDLTSTSNSLGASGVTVANIRTAIENVATLRAANGAQASQLQFANEMLTVNKANLESANSRIIDTDVAEESTRLAKFNILTQSGAAMLSQANSGSQIALRLIG